MRVVVSALSLIIIVFLSVAGIPASADSDNLIQEALAATIEVSVTGVKTAFANPNPYIRIRMLNQFEVPYNNTGSFLERWFDDTDSMLKYLEAIKPLVHDPSPRVRGTLFFLLAKENRAWADELLKQGLDDPSATIARYCLHTLLKHNCPVSLLKLQQLLPPSYTRRDRYSNHNMEYGMDNSLEVPIDLDQGYAPEIIIKASVDVLLHLTSHTNFSYNKEYCIALTKALSKPWYSPNSAFNTLLGIAPIDTYVCPPNQNHQILIQDALIRSGVDLSHILSINSDTCQSSVVADNAFQLAFRSLSENSSSSPARMIRALEEYFPLASRQNQYDFLKIALNCPKGNSRTEEIHLEKIVTSLLPDARLLSLALQAQQKHEPEALGESLAALYSSLQLTDTCTTTREVELARSILQRAPESFHFKDDYLRDFSRDYPVQHDRVDSKAIGFKPIYCKYDYGTDVFPFESLYDLARKVFSRLPAESERFRSNQHKRAIKFVYKMFDEKKEERLYYAVHLLAEFSDDTLVKKLEVFALDPNPDQEFPLPFDNAIAATISHIKKNPSDKEKFRFLLPYLVRERHGIEWADYDSKDRWVSKKYSLRRCLELIHLIDPEFVIPHFFRTGFVKLYHFVNSAQHQQPDGCKSPVIQEITSNESGELSGTVTSVHIRGEVVVASCTDEVITVEYGLLNQAGQVKFFETGTVEAKASDWRNHTFQWNWRPEKLYDLPKGKHQVVVLLTLSEGRATIPVELVSNPDLFSLHHRYIPFYQFHAGDTMPVCFDFRQLPERKRGTAEISLSIRSAEDGGDPAHLLHDSVTLDTASAELQCLPATALEFPPGKAFLVFNLRGEDIDHTQEVEIEIVSRNRVDVKCPTMVEKGSRFTAEVSVSKDYQVIDTAWACHLGRFTGADADLVEETEIGPGVRNRSVVNLATDTDTTVVCDVTIKKIAKGLTDKEESPEHYRFIKGVKVRP